MAKTNKKLQNKIRLQSSDSKYLKKFRVYPIFFYNRLDKWLKLMSKKGWHIVHCNIFSFLFEKGMPEEKEYFTYGIFSQEGKYDIKLRFPFLEKKYGVEKNKSKINSNNQKTYNILEIDLNKIDVQNDIAYKELVSTRNSLYLRYSIRNFIILLMALIFLAFLFIK